MKTLIQIIGILFLSGSMSIYQAHAQEVKTVVKIQVQDKETQESLPGVTVAISDGKTNKPYGTTDGKGMITVSVPAKSYLIFSGIGLKQTVLNPPFSKEINYVKIPTLTSALSDVVVVGYQSKSKAENPGSVTTISGKDLQDIPVSNAEQLLQGKVAGLNVQNNTGAPGFRGSVQLRGVSNIEVTGTGDQAYLTPTSPLYVIDGVPTDVDPATADGFTASGGVSPLSLIPVEDIASIEVLKDAQATSLYGSKGAYGVILITTKRGQSPVPKVSYRANFFVNVPPNLRTVLGGESERAVKIAQVLKYGSQADINTALANSYGGTILSDSLNAYFNNSTNWQALFYQPTFNQTHNLGVSGGSDKFNYKTNFNYFDENGIQVNTGQRRYNLSVNMGYAPSNKFSVTALVFTGLQERGVGSGSGLLNTGLATSASASSLLPAPSLYASTTDLLSTLTVQNKNTTRNIRSNFVISYKPISGLNINTTGSYDLYTVFQDSRTPAVANNQFAQVYSYNDIKSTVYNRNVIGYTKNLGKYHKFSATAFNEIYISAFQAYNTTQNNRASDAYLGPLGYSGAPSASTGGGLSSYTRTRSASFAGAFNYGYKGKYIVDLSYRLDATSFSGTDDPYTRSPAVGLRWNLDREKWLGSLSWVSTAALRATWGKATVPTGNLYSTYGTYTPSGIYNGTARIGLDNSLIPNTNLGAATKTTYNLGFDFGLFGNRIDVTTDTYLNILSKQTRNLSLSTTTGFNQVLSNEIGLDNYGYEIQVNIRPLPASSKIGWVIGLNGAVNKDVLTHLPGGVSQIIFGDIAFRVGKNSLSNYLYINNGVYSTAQNVPTDPVTGLPIRSSSGAKSFFQAGDAAFKDLNGDYVIDNNDRDIVGNSQPIFTGGFNTTVSYKQLSLALSGSFTGNRSIINSAYAQMLVNTGAPFGVTSGTKTTYYGVLPLGDANYWTKSGDVAKYADPYNYTRASIANSFRTNQTLFMEDGTYLKLNTATIAYTFSHNWISRLGISGLRMYLSANNVATFSRYSGPNPENVSNVGYDNSGGYPNARSYNFGFTVDL